MDSTKGFPKESRSAMESANKSPLEDQSSAVEMEETIPDSFVCCVCLDLLYKPIVLPCGHISCFWCVHISMSGQSDSHCPVCRYSYGHFPTVCQMLHFLLLKMYPAAYKRREKQILEEEKERDSFSPQLDGLAWESRNCLTGSGPSSAIDSNANSCEDFKSTSKIELCRSDKQLEACDEGAIFNRRSSKKINCGLQSIADKKKEVSIADLLCLTCKQLLFHPVVLNCGHVYCEACTINPAAEILRCQVCESLHPRGIPKVCLVLDHFLEEKFPKEYELRRDALQLKQPSFKNESSSSSSAEAGNQDSSSSAAPPGNLPFTFDPHSKVHMGVGCDFCGMYPIIGDRYKCKDCVEKIGFDLCGDCYKSRAKLPGRFNQQHTAEHKFELIKPHIFRYLEVWPIPRNIDQEDDTFVIPEGASVTIEDGILIASLPDNSERNNTSNDAGAPVTPPGENVEMEDQDAPVALPEDGNESDVQ